MVVPAFGRNCRTRRKCAGFAAAMTIRTGAVGRTPGQDRFRRGPAPFRARLDVRAEGSRRGTRKRPPLMAGRVAGTRGPRVLKTTTVSPCLYGADMALASTNCTGPSRPEGHNDELAL